MARSKPENDAFALRLRNLMLQHGLSQSDLAAKIWGRRIDPVTGYSVAIGRDRICNYACGEQYPSARNMLLLAEALGVEVGDLADPLEARALARARAILGRSPLDFDAG